jgi:hypothetical protein
MRLGEKAILRGFLRSIKNYYYLTPIFILLYLFSNLNLRIVFPGDFPYLPYGYMIGCFIIGGFVLKSPIALSLFALCESAVNILLLIVSVLMPLWSMGDDIDAFSTFRFGIIELIHFCIAATVLLVGFYANPIIRGKI